MATRPVERGVQTSRADEFSEPEDRLSLGAAAGWFGGAVLLFLLAAASSTDSVPLWVAPEASPQPAPTSVVVDDVAPPIVADTADTQGSLFGVLLVLLVVLLGLALLRANLRLSPLAERLKQRLGWAELTTATQTPLPDGATDELRDEISEARNALLDGDARNGIVASWMRLERGGLDVGLPRWAAETAEEYSQRMAVSRSVDPEALGDLAELYREARFSEHELNEDHRDRASDALGRIERELGAPQLGAVRSDTP